jgi:hypothetical protein
MRRREFVALVGGIAAFPVAALVLSPAKIWRTDFTGRMYKRRRVLMLHVCGHAYSPWSDMAGSFRAELVTRSPEPIDLCEVSLLQRWEIGEAALPPANLVQFREPTVWQQYRSEIIGALDGGMLDRLFKSPALRGQAVGK